MMDRLFDLSGVRVRLRGLDDALGERFDERWGAYAVAEDDAEVDLDVVVVALDAEMENVEFGANWTRSGSVTGIRRFGMHEGAIEIDGKRSRAEIRRGDAGRRFGGLANLVCAALATTLPSRGAAVLHGAGVVIDDIGFVLVGPEGSGKSTWLALATEAGGRPLSDDLVVVDAAGEALTVLQSPFRDETAARSAPGRWPVGAILFPAHGRPARLDDVATLEARARLLANLPFVSEDLASDGRLATLVDTVLRGTPVHTLTFDREPSFVALLRRRFTGR
ncbi:MAG: hypothetical protein R3344_04810 [Acidobacteriota bacterium]|nr:hypothetical protein [Acidobacteriota bacterium]